MPVAYDTQDHLGIITLSRPAARNAWGDDFNQGIARYCAAMEDDDAIRCAVLTGDDRGGAFSAGANLKDPRTHTLSSTADFIKSLPRRKDRPFEVLSNFSKPLVGAVNGYAIGIGCIITFCCDLLVASDAALVDLYRFMALGQTEDKNEGHAAWRERRKPAFRGR